MIQHIRWQVIIALLGMILLGSLLAYLALTRTTVIVPKRGGTYVEGLAGYPRCINPILCQYNDVDQDLASLVFSGLTKVGEANEIVPDLAEDWELSDDGLTYTFHLRRNVRWHDGVPFTADDVIFTVELIRDPNSQVSPHLATLWRDIGMRKVNDYTIEFALREPFAPFLDYTTVGILPAHLLADVEAEDLAKHGFNLRLVGTGPFQLKEVNAEHASLESNPYFYGPKPYLNRIEFRFYPNYESLYNAYKREEIEGIGRVQPEDLPKVASEPQLNLFSATLSGYAIVLLDLDNTHIPFFQEKEVRQALLCALDRQRIIDKILNGSGLVAHSPIVPPSWAYYEDITEYDYDPEKANALLGEAGWRWPDKASPEVGGKQRSGSGDVREKGGIKLEFALLSDGHPRRVELAEELARQWEKIGVRAIPKVGSVSDALRSRSFEAVLVDLEIPPDPDPYPFWHQTQIEQGQNYSGFDHREASEVLEEARCTTEQAKRIELYHRFQEIFAEEVPSLLLYYPIYNYAIDEKIKGVQVGPIINPSGRFRSIAQWYIDTKRVIVSQAKWGFDKWGP